MPRCPECGEDTPVLINSCNVRMYYICDIRDGVIEYTKEEVYDGGTDNVFACEQCGEVLTDSEEEAEAFLIGGEHAMLVKRIERDVKLIERDADA